MGGKSLFGLDVYHIFPPQRIDIGPCWNMLFPLSAHKMSGLFTKMSLFAKD